MSIANYVANKLGLNRFMAVDPDGFEPQVGTRGYGVAKRYALNGVSAQSDVIEAREVMVYPTKAALIRNGSDPTAVTNGGDSIPLDAGAFHMRIVPGEKIAFIRGSADDGFIYIVPVI